MLTRRELLLSSMLGTLATGLPAWFLTDPRRARAQDLSCAIEAQEKMQYLIVCVNSMGDPINCNCPGTYADLGGADVVHPTAWQTGIPVQFGDKTYDAAPPWENLTSEVRARTAFIHHVTRANNHGDQPKVMRLMGATSQGEMLVSAYAKHLGPCFGTIQTEPVALGAGNNASELLSFSGRSLPSISPSQLKELLTGSVGGRGFGMSQPSPLLGLRQLRDQHLNRLNQLAREDATQVQRGFLDALAKSQTQIRALAEELAETLDGINGNGVADQALAAFALISANVTPVVSVRIGFGGDNHTDSNLQAEQDQHVTGVAGIMSVLNALGGTLRDRVTFMTLNVFGRNLNGISKVESRGGRDHYGNHSVAVVIGKNVVPGVYGGVAPIASNISGAGGALGATDIDSVTGAAAPDTGDIPRLETGVSMARTVGLTLGISEADLESDFILSAGGKPIRAAVAS